MLHWCILNVRRAVSKSEAVMSLCEKTGSGHSVCVLINLFPGGRNWSEMMRFKRVNGCAALRLSSVEWASRVRGWANGRRHGNQITSPGPESLVLPVMRESNRDNMAVQASLNKTKVDGGRPTCVRPFILHAEKKFSLHGTELELWLRHLPDPKSRFEDIAPVCARRTSVSLSLRAYIGATLFFPRDSLGVQVCARSAVCAQGSWWHPSPRGNQPALPAVAARPPACSSSSGSFQKHLVVYMQHAPPARRLAGSSTARTSPAASSHKNTMTQKSPGIAGQTAGLKTTMWKNAEVCGSAAAA